MTKRQLALIDYHRDVASLTASSDEGVFIVLDLEDSAGFELASSMHPNCAEKRDAIRESGSIPAFTLVLPLPEANLMIAHGWPQMKRIPNPPPDMIPMLVIADERCLSVFIPKE